MAGERSVLSPADFMVVAPYNDQVHLVRRCSLRTNALQLSRLARWTSSKGQRPPVLFTMATSTGDDMPREPEFLFSRNRLNVALSRANSLPALFATKTCWTAGSNR